VLLAIQEDKTASAHDRVVAAKHLIADADKELLKPEASPPPTLAPLTSPSSEPEEPPRLPSLDERFQ
jgi:hypothetical protein